jgi:hypothetical protein
MSYTVSELSELLSISEKTCFRWIEEGLPTIPDSKKPILILGNDAKEFIRRRNIKGKVKLKRYEFYCLKCRGPTRAKRGSIEVLGSVKRGVCSVCNGKMRRAIRPYQKDYHIPSTPIQMSIFSNNLTNDENDKFNASK